MSASEVLLQFAEYFVQCFTRPGFAHFVYFLVAHACLFGQPRLVSEMMRLTLAHEHWHWTTPYAFMKSGRWSVRQVATVLARLVLERLHIKELIVAIDDTIAPHSGKKIEAVSYYPDPTDKNPGASKRKVLAHCWVTIALLYERSPKQWLAFPLYAALFIPQALCLAMGIKPATKIEMACGFICWLADLAGRQAIVVTDNMYAKRSVIETLNKRGGTLVSRLHSNAALYLVPAPPKPGQRGRPAKRGKKVSPRGLWNCDHRRKRKLRVTIYGQQVTIRAWVGELVSSSTLAYTRIVAVIFPQRSGKKMNVFFSTDISMTPERLLELYAARYKIEECFRELKSQGGLGSCRQRSVKAQERHSCLCLVAYSLLRLMTLMPKVARQVGDVPWYTPQGPPSVTRLRRQCLQSWGISDSLPKRTKLTRNPRRKPSPWPPETSGAQPTP